MSQADSLPLSEQETVFSEQENVLSEQENVLSEQETVFSEQENVLSEQETVLSEQETVLSEQEIVNVTEATESRDDSLPLTEEQVMHRKQRKSNVGLSRGESVKQTENVPNANMNDKSKPGLPLKPDLNLSGNKPSSIPRKRSKKDVKGELIVSELYSESESDQSRKDSDKSQQEMRQKLMNGSVSGASVVRTDSKSKVRKSSSSSSSKTDVGKDSNQNITYMKHEDKPVDKSRTASEKQSVDIIANSKEKSEVTAENGNTKNRRNKRRQVNPSGICQESFAAHDKHYGVLV